MTVIDEYQGNGVGSRLMDALLALARKRGVTRIIAEVLRENTGMRALVNRYRAVVQRSDDPVVLVQDYHFALLPRMVRERLPKATIIMFWHIPWPNPESFGICPWREELLQGLLGNTLLGFHTPFHCKNFLETVDRYLETRIEHEASTISYGGELTQVEPYPISIAWPDPDTGIDVVRCREITRKELRLPSSHRLALGVDRLDYTKGIVERFQAVDRLLEMHPDLVGRFSLLQIAAPSRSSLDEYQNLEARVRKLAHDDDIAVAGPVITKSSRMQENELVELARTKGQAHLAVIAGRKDIGEAVTDVLVRRGEYTAVPLSNWDTMGFRGTCSSGFTLAARGHSNQIIPEPFADILSQTMHPYSHIVWGSLWTGIAIDAVNQARAFVRTEARRTPGKIAFASSGNGGAPHLSGELFRLVAGIDLLHVPYKGSGPAVTDLVGGQVQIMFDGAPSLIAHIQSGKLRVLGVYNSKRYHLIPDVPTVAEEVPGYEPPPGWMGYLAPAGLPRALVTRLHAELAKYFTEPTMQSRADAAGILISTSTPEEFARLVARDIDTWTRVVKAGNIKVN